MLNATFAASYRRMLLDIQIPDWDDAFLQDLDAGKLVAAYKRANVDSVMFYCQSHVGLCYWPTKSGQVHRAFHGRDFVAEMLTLLSEQQMQTCGYYSVIYNNWAFLEHPEWRIKPAAPVQLHKLPSARYGHCCPNNPGYRQFIEAQIEELFTSYQFDAFFFDMVWWPTICVCDSCQSRFQKETGKDIPQVIDWHDPNWCRFQLQREAWIDDFGAFLRAWAQKIQPEVIIYHNFAVSMFNWTRGLSLRTASNHDFLGGDFYGDPLEQQLVSQVMIHLSDGHPVEFMTTKCADLTECVQLKSEEQLQMQAFAATASSSAFLMIDTIHPDGSFDAEQYKPISNIFERVGRYKEYLGGEPLADVAVYFSSHSKMNFTENGTPLAHAALGAHNYPHITAVRGAVERLQHGHLPFAVITEKQLPVLSDYKAIILPNILRMDTAEVDAIRDYVRQGGKLYASRYTSLTDTTGKRYPDFLLADTFGCHFEQPEQGRVGYINPCSEITRQALLPQDLLSHWNDPEACTGTVTLAAECSGTVLATLTLPYGHPHAGSVQDTHWASIHTFPPWKHTTAPVIVRNRFGAGEVIYSAADIETGRSEAHGRLFLALLQSMLDAPLSLSVQAHPAVWVTAFHQPNHDRIILSFLNYQQQLPPVPLTDVHFQLRAIAGKRFSQLRLLPEENDLCFQLHADGTLNATMAKLTDFRMLAAIYLDS